MGVFDFLFSNKLAGWSLFILCLSMLSLYSLIWRGYSCSCCVKSKKKTDEINFNNIIMSLSIITGFLLILSLFYIFNFDFMQNDKYNLFLLVLKTLSALAIVGCSIYLTILVYNFDCDSLNKELAISVLIISIVYTILLFIILFNHQRFMELHHES
jgi:hypothetical protein